MLYLGESSVKVIGPCSVMSARAAFADRHAIHPVSTKPGAGGAGGAGRQRCSAAAARRCRWRGRRRAGAGVAGGAGGVGGSRSSRGSRGSRGSRVLGVLAKASAERCGSCGALASAWPMGSTAATAPLMPAAIPFAMPFEIPSAMPPAIPAATPFDTPALAGAVAGAWATTRGSSPVDSALASEWDVSPGPCCPTPAPAASSSVSARLAAARPTRPSVPRTRRIGARGRQRSTRRGHRHESWACAAGRRAAAAPRTCARPSDRRSGRVSSQQCSRSARIASTPRPRDDRRQRFGVVCSVHRVVVAADDASSC